MVRRESGTIYRLVCKPSPKSTLLIDKCRNKIFFLNLFSFHQLKDVSLQRQMIKTL